MTMTPTEDYAAVSAEKIYEFLLVADAPVKEIVYPTSKSLSHVLKIIHALERQDKVYLKAYIRQVGKGGKPVAIYAAGPKPKGHTPEELNRSKKFTSAIRRWKEYPELGPYAQLLNS